MTSDLIANLIIPGFEGADVRNDSENVCSEVEGDMNFELHERRMQTFKSTALACDSKQH